MDTLLPLDLCGATATPSDGEGPDIDALTSGAIHCWYFDLTAPLGDGPDLARVLSNAELQRGARISNPLSQRRFLTSKALTRSILGRYLDIEPQSIRLTTGPYGKPRLAGSDGVSGLVFNASHTAEQGALALGFDGRLGVDLQEWRSIRDVAALLRRCCASTEQAYWSKQEASFQQAALFRFWTLKEAFCKAVGRGLALGLNRCVFDCDGPRPQLIAQPAELADCGHWDFVELALPPGISGAIAFNRPIRALREFTVDTRAGR